jgi:cobalt/nickel transport system permease protein
MENKIPSYLIDPADAAPNKAGSKKASLTFLDKTVMNSARAAKSIYIQSENARGISLIHNIHPFIKLISLIYIVVIISLVNNLFSQFICTVFILILFIIARLNIASVYRKIFFLAFIFGFLVILPASLNVITPGKIVFKLFSLNMPVNFWIYHIPQNIGFTENGIRVVGLVFLRVLNSVSFAMLIVFTTSFPAFVKSFRILGVPDTFQMIITLAYKYIFILSRTIEDTYLALKSRLSGNIKNSNIRNLIGGRIFFTFKRSVIIYENTYFAMISRGYKGKVILHSQKNLSLFDFAALLIILVIGICFLFI